MHGYSHIIIGAGAIGAAAAYWLSALGAKRVLVIEQYDLVNTLNSSGDHSRIIRHAYHDASYTRLTPAMYNTWTEIEQRSGLPIYLKTGGLDISPATGPGREDLEAYKIAMRQSGISFDELDSAALKEKYPQFDVPSDTLAIFQEASGLIDIRRSVSAHTSLALSNGVEFLPKTRVTRTNIGTESVAVETSAGTFAADHLIVAAGSWLSELMPSLGFHYNLYLSQEQVSYFATPHLPEFTPDKFPIWIYHDEQTFYGFPVYGEAGVKLARDMRGRMIRSDERVFEGDEAEAEVLRGFLRRHLPRAAGPALANKTCVYDMPADRDFVLDTLPGADHVAVFNGAGHAGKFASLIGQILAQKLLDIRVDHDLTRFKLDRPAITDPTFVPTFKFRAHS